MHKPTEQWGGLSFYVIDENDISPELDKEIRNSLVISFPDDREYFSRQSWWHCHPVFRIFAQRDTGQIVAHIAIIDRTILAGPAESHIRVAGIQSVFVLPKYQGLGISDKAMSIAIDQTKERAFDACLLFCHPRLESIYGRMGWTKINQPVYMLDEKENKIPISEKSITMFHPLKVSELPTSQINLAGADW